MLPKVNAFQFVKCCGRSPVVSCMVDLEDSPDGILTRYIAYCPTCDSLTSDFSLPLLVKRWNEEVKVCFDEGST